MSARAERTPDNLFPYIGCHAPSPGSSNHSIRSRLRAIYPYLLAVISITPIFRLSLEVRDCCNNDLVGLMHINDFVWEMMQKPLAMFASNDLTEPRLLYDSGNCRVYVLYQSLP